MDMAAAESGSTPTAASDGPVYLIMGVCGTGKTSLAQELALRLGLAAHDADDFHTAANKAKMASGTPLDDDDRRPWLDILSAEAAGWARGGGALMACSALKRSYRTQLRASCPSLLFSSMCRPRSCASDWPPARTTTCPPRSSTASSPPWSRPRPTRARSYTCRSVSRPRPFPRWPRSCASVLMR